MKTAIRYRYIDDYKTVPYVAANGRSKEKVQYIGEWVLFLDNEAVLRKKFWIMRVTAIVSFLALFGALLCSGETDLFEFATIPLAMGLFPLTYQIMGICSLPRKFAPMERRPYQHGVPRVNHSAMGLAILGGVGLLARLTVTILGAFHVVQAAAFGWLDVLFLFSTVVLIGMNLLCFLSSRKIAVEERQNEDFPSKPR